MNEARLCRTSSCQAAHRVSAPHSPAKAVCNSSCTALQMVVLGSSFHCGRCGLWLGGGTWLEDIPASSRGAAAGAGERIGPVRSGRTRSLKVWTLQGVRPLLWCLGETWLWRKGLPLPQQPSGLTLCRSAAQRRRSQASNAAAVAGHTRTATLGGWAPGAGLGKEEEGMGTKHAGSWSRGARAKPKPTGAPGSAGSGAAARGGWAAALAGDAAAGGLRPPGSWRMGWQPRAAPRPKLHSPGI
jgi:hypothetical protein